MFLLALVSFSDHLSSVVCLSVPPSLCKLFTFSSSPEPRGQFKPNLAQNILKWRGFRFVQFKVHVLFLGGDDNETSKIHWRNLKIFSRTTSPISVKIETYILSWRGFKFEGTCRFWRDENETSKIHGRNFLLVNHWAIFNQSWHKASLG